MLPLTQYPYRQFLMGSLEDIFKKKPFLKLELDEHSGDEGIRTRIEAFLDIIGSEKK